MSNERTPINGICRTKRESRAANPFSASPPSFPRKNVTPVKTGAGIRIPTKIVIGA